MASVLIAAVLVIAPAAGASSTPAWSTVPSPNRGANANILYAVSCASTSACTAVGFGSTDRNLIESWDGTRWSLVPSPQPGIGDSLNGVSCLPGATPPGMCVAVGDYSVGASGKTLVESWNGSSWSVMPTPYTGHGSSGLSSVSCVSAAACVAVGDYYLTSKGVDRPLVESWNGGSWSVAPSPSPHPGDNFLFGVSCVSAAACTAAGQYLNNSQIQRTLIESGTASAAHAG